jgi:phosphoglycerate dehydrogenase-like enzyme
MLDGLHHIRINSPADLTEAAKEAEVILHWAGPRDLLRTVFLASPAVRWVHSRSAGLDRILFPELAQSPVPLTNGSGVFSQSLGEFAFAAILYFAKDFRRMLRNQEAGRWEQFLVEEIAGQTVGIVGYGDIGRAVASRVHAMGMCVLALKRHAPATPDPFVDQFYKPDKLSGLLAQCDYVVVAAPLTAETRHMISDAAFAAMKPNAVVINVGRGPVIDQAAMVRALTEKRIKGAGLDVFEEEPIPSGDPIYKLENVLISPHCADQTKVWLRQAMQFFLQQYERFCNGEPLENIVEKHLGY